jgi:hypothetical protein
MREAVLALQPDLHCPSRGNLLKGTSWGCMIALNEFEQPIGIRRLRTCVTCIDSMVEEKIICRHLRDSLHLCGRNNEL